MLDDLLDGQHLEARRGQLDGERDPVEADAEIGDLSEVGVGDGEPGLNQAGPLGEQLDRCGVLIHPQ
jgi:hypothetical protein